MYTKRILQLCLLEYKQMKSVICALVPGVFENNVLASNSAVKSSQIFKSKRPATSMGLGLLGVIYGNPRYSDTDIEHRVNKGANHIYNL